MFVNANFSLPAIITPLQHQWVASPQPGIERMMLDRVGHEKARATSLVRYAPHSAFPAHQHPGGEEILVLSGTFSDGDGHYPAGWYLRNPPGSGHAPSTREGTLLFVKLWQMPPTEGRSVRINTRDASRWTDPGDRQSCLLFTDDEEHVSLQRLSADTPLFDTAVEGAEILILAGQLLQNGERYDCGTWIRLPSGDYRGFSAGSDGATVYLKTGPLKTQPPAEGALC
jgi:anti-sigma factor ChrR (cupin superfamily)